VHVPEQRRLKSLYFDYEVFPFVPPPELAGEARRHPVAIVGAGPVGLEVALELARYGVASVVIEAGNTVSEGSRAVCLARRSMEIMQQLGLDQRFLEKGLPWTGGRSFYRDEVVFNLDMPHDDDDRFHPMTNLQQCYIEQYMLDRIADSDLIDVRFASKVIEIENGSDGARLRVDTPDGDYWLDADWVVAADGARSAMRKLMGLRLTGDSYEGRFVIADIQIALDHPIERRAFFDPPWNPGNTVLFHKQPDDIWRVDYRLPDDETEEEALQEATIRKRIQQHLDMLEIDLPWELDWYSIYSANTLTLERYVHGRVCFAGDAAHLLPIFGVRGLNTGWIDANNLGWKLAFVANGWSSDALLDSYSDERVAAAREICEEAAKSTRFMTPPTRGYTLMRDATLSLSLSEEFPKNLLHWRTSRPQDYVDSRLNAAVDDDASFVAGPRVGAPLANVRLAPQRMGDNSDAFLLDYLGAGFNLICFVDAGGLAADVAAAIDRLGAGPLPVTCLLVAAADTAHAGAGVIADPQRRVFAKYGADPGTVYLIRPDGHVCGRWRRPTAAQLQDAVQRAAVAREREAVR